MLGPLCAALALVLAAPASARSPHAPDRAAPAQRSRAPDRASELERARALLAQVKRDPAKRRYRHHWERAIAALEKAARGRDAGPALLEAARARYALYRFSQVDSDREAALKLAVRAGRAGAREATAFAAAVRREMGEEEQRPSAKAVARPKSAPRAAPAPAPAEDAEGEDEEEAEAEPAGDPVLDKALAAAERDEPTQEPQPAHVSDVQSWSNADYTRVAIYLSRPIGFSKEEIPADGDRPRRLALDLKPAQLGHELAHRVGDSLVQRVRAAQRDGDTVRVVLDLAGTQAVSIFSLQDPPRLIVDVGVREARREAREPAPPAAADGELAARRPVRRVIVDAGHGGHDTGAIGPTRVREKDVTLAIAKRVSARLRARGFEVVLTREDDRYVPLEERTAIANARHGDLFLSIHANAHPRRDRRGVETYVLNVADDRYAARLAARENGALADDAGQEVRRILADLDAQSSAEPSRRLAQAVQRQVCAGIRGRVGDVRDLGVKGALFYVLLGARMPAVLLEASFLSNRTEERRLQSAGFQDEVAASVARAVDDFAKREGRLASR